MQNMNVSKEQRNKGRRDFLLLVAVFFLPIVIVLVLYFNLDKWDIGGERNNGDLIQPPRQLQNIELTDLQGKSFSFSDVRDKWLMIQFGSASCDESCKEKLYLTRQIRLAQGGNSQRVKRIYISTDGKPDESMQKQISEHPELLVVYGNETGVEQVKDQFRHDVGNGPVLQALYLADPRGFLMMSYPEGYDPKGAITDMERLLKFARSG